MSIKVTCSSAAHGWSIKGPPRWSSPARNARRRSRSFRPAGAAPSPAILPVAGPPIAAVAVEETKPQPAVAQKVVTAAPAKRSAVVLIVLGGLAAAFGGLCLLILACGGIAVLLLGSDRKESLASDSKGEPFSTVSDIGYTGGSYSPSPAIDFTAAPGATGDATDKAAAAAEQARLEEEQRRLGVEAYYAELDAERAARAGSRRTLSRSVPRNVSDPGSVSLDLVALGGATAAHGVCQHPGADKMPAP